MSIATIEAVTAEVAENWACRGRLILEGLGARAAFCTCLSDFEALIEKSVDTKRIRVARVWQSK